MSRESPLIDFPVIGIGASAGGLEAFQTLVAGLRADHPFALVLVQHLDPDHKSLLPDLLSRRTAMRVRAIEDDMAVEPGSVYLIPPACELFLEAGRLRLHSFEEPRGHRRPIDHFFQSLAREQGERCAAVVLSGTGSDGSSGVRAVKEAGGLVIAQEPRSAKYDGMPRSAIATGAVDLIVPAGEVMQVCEDYFDRAPPTDAVQSDADFIGRVAKHLRYRTGHDFARYKHSTFMRRVARRMSVTGRHEPAAYLQHLISDRGEAQALFHDLLINVTNFFRDREAFEALATRAIGALFDGKGCDDHVRIWVAGCSTGQEAYSIAMLCAREVERLDTKPDIAVFATDIDDKALEIARAATYPATIEDEVPADMLADYFVPVGDGYRVIERIREMVRFSTHNVTKDPPFSRLDLVSCRNLLIYFESALQDQVTPVFQYALKPGGFLFLGSSENPGAVRDRFADVDSSARLYRRDDGPVLPLTLAGQGVSLPRPDPARDRDRPVPRDRADEYLVRVAKRHLPCFLVVDGQGQLLYSHGDASPWLRVAEGVPVNELVRLARPGFDGAAKRLLAAPLSHDGERLERHFEGEIDGVQHRLDLSVERIGPGERAIMIRPVADGADRSALPFLPIESGDDYVSELERELQEARQTIRTTVEELETSNEELKSSNEEMMSMNEELQSANEELSTVNEELHNKVAELDRANADLTNFMTATEVATVFVNADTGVRSYTPAATAYLRLTDSDIGRPLEDIASRLDDDRLLPELREALRDGEVRRFDDGAGRGTVDLQVRIAPYLGTHGRPDGAAIVFTPVTDIKQALRKAGAAEREAREGLAEIEQLYRWSPKAMALVDPDRQVLRANARMAALSPLDENTLSGRRIDELLRDLPGPVIDAIDSVLATGEPADHRAIRLNTPEGPRMFDIDWYPVFDEAGRVAAVGLNMRDVTRYKEMEAELRHVMRELQHRVKNMLANVQALIRRAQRDTGEPRAVLETLVQRIQALAATHNLLTAGNWSGARLSEILSLELIQVYGGARIALRGPDVHLSSRATVSLSMALHELATNAAKYGALSVPEGRLEVSWARSDMGEGERLIIDWREVDGPAVAAPERSGFGRQLVTSIVSQSLGGKIDAQFEPAGLRCVMEMPYSRITATDDDELSTLGAF